MAGVDARGLMFEMTPTKRWCRHDDSVSRQAIPLHRAVHGVAVKLAVRSHRLSEVLDRFYWGFIATCSKPP